MYKPGEWVVENFGRFRNFVWKKISDEDFCVVRILRKFVVLNSEREKKGERESLRDEIAICISFEKESIPLKS